MKIQRTALLLVALAALAAPARPDDTALDLPIGDPARRDKHAELVLDAATDSATGDVLTSQELAARLKDVRVLFVGESHTSIEFHNVQLAAIKALAASGRPVLIGLEMYPYTEQQWLDKWNAGALGEQAFVAESGWYKTWSYHWNYYRDIFEYARLHKLPMYAVNTPREVISAVRKKGFADLTPEEAAHIPDKVDTDNAEHKRLFKAFFGPADSMHVASMSEEQWDGMFRAQCAWDATMGKNAVDNLVKHGSKDAIMVVLIGSGHVAYGLGAERQAKLWFDGRIASLIPITVTDEKGQRPLVRASYANFVWGVKREADELYPRVGFSTPERKQGEHYNVIAVPKDSIAAKAGFQVGDLLLSMDGTPLDDKETFHRLQSGKRWGDSASFTVKRGEQTLTLVARFRRTLPEDEEQPGAEPAAAKGGR